MKKYKKIFLIIVSTLLSLLIILQVYYRISNDGNLIFFLSRDLFYDEYPSYSYEIYLDGKKVSEGIYSDYKNVSVKTSPWFHEAVIKINGDESRKIKFNTFLVTFVLVDYWNSEYRGQIHRNPLILIKIQKHHIILIA
jgi:hypothetical protein